MTPVCPGPFDTVIARREQRESSLAFTSIPKPELPMTAVLDVDTTNFADEVLAADQPVIVDFWAEWCGPCRMVAREVDALADAHPDVKVVKVNIDDAPDLAQRYQVMSIPTIALFRDGEMAARSVGAKTRTALASDLALAG